MPENIGGSQTNNKIVTRIYVKHDKSMEHPLKNIVSTTINFDALKAIREFFLSLRPHSFSMLANFNMTLINIFEQNSTCFWLIYLPLKHHSHFSIFIRQTDSHTLCRKCGVKKSRKKCSCWYWKISVRKMTTIKEKINLRNLFAELQKLCNKVFMLISLFRRRYE